LIIGVLRSPVGVLRPAGTGRLERHALCRSNKS
jgi:hypothetical protein